MYYDTTMYRTGVVCDAQYSLGGLLVKHDIGYRAIMFNIEYSSVHYKNITRLSIVIIIGQMMFLVGYSSEGLLT